MGDFVELARMMPDDKQDKLLGIISSFVKDKELRSKFVRNLIDGSPCIWGLGVVASMNVCLTQHDDY
jgi:hypothetical protein